MKCPICLSEDTKVVESRSKDWNKIGKVFSIVDIPAETEMLDYRLRRHKCNACGRSFSTVETYYNKADILSYNKNTLSGLKKNSQKIQVL